MVDPDEAAKNPTWWTDERYAIYDLSPNSAIAFPAHDERISWASWKESYNVRGYAYSGGGRRITRCEVSLDKGKTWRLAHIDYAEDRYRASEGRELFGARLDMDWRETSFCWCFWELNVSTAELKNAGDIVVRAMDEAMCVQPRDMYWNVLGMMNNPWFRIAIHKEDGTLRFEHPTQPALMPGGWMERVKKAGGNLTNGQWGDKIEGVEPEQTATEDAQEIKMTNYCVDRVIEVDELKEHEGANNPWFVVSGEVYDGTPFLEEHPGGARSILSAAGLDSTDEFMTIRKPLLFPPIPYLTPPHRQRNRKDHAANLPHRHPLPNSPRLPHHLRYHIHFQPPKPKRLLPLSTHLVQSTAPLQSYSFPRHPHLPLCLGVLHANPRAPHRPTRAPKITRPRSPRYGRARLYSCFVARRARLLRRARQSVHNGPHGVSVGHAAARARRGIQGSSGEFPVPRCWCLRFQGHAAARDGVEHGLWRLGHHANLPGGQRGAAERGGYDAVYGSVR